MFRFTRSRIFVWDSVSVWHVAGRVGRERDESNSIAYAKGRKQAIVLYTRVHRLVAGTMQSFRMACPLARRAFYSSEVGTGSVYGRKVGRVGHIFIDNQAKKNAMSLNMYRQVPIAINEALNGIMNTTSSGDDEDAVRVVILQGEGTEAFGAGSDILEFPKVRHNAEAAAEYSAIEDAAAESLLAVKQPLIAKIRGPCIGGGLNLALTADVRYASEDSIFCVPPAKLGIGYPQQLMDLLLMAVGRSRAKDLLFTARTINAEEALRIGLVDAVVPNDELDEHVERVASTMTQLAPLTTQAAKLAANQDPNAIQKCSDCYESNDYKEGIQAFLEKRRPQFFGT